MISVHLEIVDRLDEQGKCNENTFYTAYRTTQNMDNYSEHRLIRLPDNSNFRCFEQNFNPSRHFPSKIRSIIRHPLIRTFR